MRIDNININNQELNRKVNLKEGNTVRAEVIDIIGEEVILDIKGYGLVEARVDVDINELIGDNLLFLIKSLDDGQIILKPVTEEEVIEVFDQKTDNIVNILKELGIKDSPESREVVELLMDNNIAVNNKNIIGVLKNIDKFLGLININEADNVVVLDKDIDKMLSDLYFNDKINLENNNNENTVSSLEGKELEENIFFEKNVVDIDNSKLSEDLENKIETLQKQVNNALLDEKEETNSMKRLNLDKKEVLSKIEDKILGVDIKQILINQKDNLEVENNFVDLVTKEIILDFLKDIPLDDRDSMKKIFTFFIKNEIKPSLNNIKNFNQFIENPTKYIKEIIEQKENILNSTNGEKEEGKNTTIEKIEEQILEIKKDNITLEIKEDIRQLDNKLDFLREMNKDLSFIFMPMHTKEERYKGLISLLKEDKEGSSGKNRSSVFIDLNTHNLGNIKISCQAISNNISVRLKINKEDYDLFMENQDELINRINLTGYIVDKIDLIYDKDFHLIDDMINNSDSNYFLDIRV